MTDQERLCRRYQRLLRWYPRWYRRERGLELLTTLLDDAAPGRRRPRLVDVATLIGGGLRTRLRPPRRLSAWGVAALTAGSAALAGGSAAVIMSGFPGPPTEEQAIAVATIAVGPPAHNRLGPAVDDCAPCYWSGFDDQVVAEEQPPMRIDNTVVFYSSTQASTVLAQARDRLSAAGWHTDPVAGEERTADVTATTDRWNVLVTSFRLPPDDPRSSDPLVLVYLSKRVPPATVIGVAVASLGGLIAGWLIGVWMLQRSQRHRFARRMMIRLAMDPFLATAFLVILLTGIIVTLDYLDGIDLTDVQAPLAFAGFRWFGSGLAIFSAVLGLITLVLTALPGAPGDPVRSTGRAAETVTESGL